MRTQSKPTILIIDDQPDGLTQAMEILGNRDYGVTAATCAEAAVRESSQSGPDLMLCDILFHRRCRQGDLIAEIHKLPRCANMPVIFSSFGQKAGVIRRQHHFGGAYHVKKPFDANVLIALVERSLWMPQFVQTHVSRPHFHVGPSAPAIPFCRTLLPIHQ